MIPATKLSFGERRKYERVNLEVPVSLRWGSEWHCIETVTWNLSSKGFYCVSRTPVPAVGQKGGAILLIPLPESEQIGLECEVHIIRVERVPGGYALGCHIERLLQVH